MMRSVPLFTEIQAVQTIFGPGVQDRATGIVIKCEWQEANTIRQTGPHAARWIYEVQLGDPKELFEIWVPEGELQAR